MNLQKNAKTSPSIMLDGALSLAQSGFPVFPLGNAGTDGAKKPRKGSNGFKDATVDPEVIQSWWEQTPWANIGVATGESSLTLVLDVDYRHGGKEALQELEQKHGPLPKTVRTVTGNGTHFYLLYPSHLADQGRIKFKANIGPGLDIKADGGYVVAPPSIHPNGNQYVFHSDGHPDTTGLAEAPEWLLSKACSVESTIETLPVMEYYLQETTPYGRKALEAEMEKITQAPHGQQEQTFNTSIIKIGSLVKSNEISSEDAFYGLVQAGLSMPNESGREPWTRESIERKVNRGLEQAVARSPKDRQPLEIVVETIFEELEHAPLSDDEPEPEEIPDVIANPPGMLGQIAHHIYETALYPSRYLAIAPAITLLGIIKGHKIQTPNGLRTNVYIISIAPSGSGKEHGRRYINNALQELDLIGLLGGAPASTAGLLKVLYAHEGKVLLAIDEMGPYLKGALGSKAPSHMQGIAALLMTLLTSANTVYIGNEYANHDGSRPREDIDQPHLVILGTTTPSEFYGSLTSAEALNGLLARMLLLEDGPPVLFKNRNRADRNLPDAIKRELENWKNQPTNWAPLGNLDVHSSIRPKTISFHPEAESMLDDYAIRMRQKAFSRAHRNTGRDAIYNRAAEHAEKLALIATDFDEHCISVETTRWAITFATYCIERLCNAVEHHVSDNANEANIKQVLTILRDYGTWMPASALTIKTQFLKGKHQRNEILEHLLMTGQIEARTLKGATKNSIQYRVKK